MGYKKVQPDTFTIINHLGIEAQIPLPERILEDNNNLLEFLDYLAQRYGLSHQHLLSKADFTHSSGDGYRTRLETSINGEQILKSIHVTDTPEAQIDHGTRWRNDAIVIEKYNSAVISYLGEPIKRRIDIVWSNFNGNRDVLINDNLYMTHPNAVNLELQFITDNKNEVIEVRIEIEASTTDPTNMTASTTAQQIYDEIQSWLNTHRAVISTKALSDC